MRDEPRRSVVHATALAVGAAAVLLRGASGAGKSDLALRCIASDPGPFAAGRFGLIADDQVELTVQDARLIASCPGPLRGLIEVRGVGIVGVRPASPQPVRLVVDLVDARAVPRMPDEMEVIEIAGFSVAHARLDPWPASAPLKLALLLERAIAVGTTAAVSQSQD